MNDKHRLKKRKGNVYIISRSCKYALHNLHGETLQVHCFTRPSNRSK